MNNHNHDENCSCGIHDQIHAGVSPKEAVANFRKWEQESLEKFGWYVHYVGDDREVPTGFNAHTHGLENKYNHLDLQIVCPLPQHVAHGIFWNIVNRIATGEKFKAGDVVSDIAGNGYKVKFVNAWENDRLLLRVIIPDKHHHLDRDNLTDNLELQYADLDHEYELGGRD